VYYPNKSKQITDWIDPGEEIDSGVGRISGEEWVYNLKAQLDRDSKRKTEIEWKNGQLALFANPFRWGYACPCEDCRTFMPVEVHGRASG